MKGFVALFCILLLTYAYSAILPANCDHLNGWKKSECKNILADESLSAEQKEDLYLNLLSEQGMLPDYDFVWSWNTSLNFSEAPANVQQFSSGIIKNAWLKIIAIDRSFFNLDSNQWYAEPSGRVLVASNFEIVLPKGTAEHDCKTERSYKLLANDLSVFLNGSKIGSQRVSSYSAGKEKDLNFSAELFIKAKLIEKHFRKQSHCAQFCNEVCTIYCWTSCDYYKTTERTDSLKLNDEFKAKAYFFDFNLTSAVELKDGISEARYMIESSMPVNEFTVSFGNDEFSFSEENFDIASTLEPYDVLFVIRRGTFGKSAHGLIDLNSNLSSKRKFIKLGIARASSCKMKLYSAFEEFDLSDKCLIEAKPAELSLSLNSDSFSENEYVRATAILTSNGKPLANREIVFFNGRQRIKALTDENGVAKTEFLSSDSGGFIRAEFSSFEYIKTAKVKRFFVYSQKSWKTAFDGSVFVSLYFATFFAAKKALGGLL